MFVLYFTIGNSLESNLDPLFYEFYNIELNSNVSINFTEEIDPLPHIAINVTEGTSAEHADFKSGDMVVRIEQSNMEMVFKIDEQNMNRNTLQKIRMKIETMLNENNNIVIRVARHNNNLGISKRLTTFEETAMVFVLGCIGYFSRQLCDSFLFRWLSFIVTLQAALMWFAFALNFVFQLLFFSIENTTNWIYVGCWLSVPGIVML